MPDTRGTSYGIADEVVLEEVGLQSGRRQNLNNTFVKFCIL